MWWIMVTLSAIVVAVDSLSCEEARLKCAYRVGCGRALQNYAMDCSTVLQGEQPSYCPELCQHSLIALTSTDEGKELMECECSDDFCAEQKRRVEICRPQVMKQVNEPILPCRVAQWICAADAMCSTAFDYYNQLCRSMFHGKKCTSKCNNSIAILRRQEKAAKLTNCRCDGTEDFECRTIQKNMERLCFHRHQRPTNTHQHDRKNDTSIVHHNREKIDRNGNNHQPKHTTSRPEVVNVDVENPNSSVRNSCKNFFVIYTLSLIIFLLNS